MTIETVAGENIGTGVRVTLSTANDAAYVLSTGVVSSEDDTAIQGLSAGHHVTIEGFVAADEHAVELGSNAVTTPGQFVFVAKTGHLRNYPEVTDQAAIKIMGPDSYVENNGRIWSTGSGIFINATFIGGQSVAINRGSIIAGDDGILHDGNQTLVVTNTGSLQGGLSAYTSLGASIDIVNNSGTMTGNINFGSGNDQYRGANGRVVGLVDGGTADDMLTGGKFADRFEGGNEDDTLTGNAGNDRLFGEADVDRLTGGLGRDDLTGGTEADLFIFKSVAESRGATRDKIFDFSRAQGDKIHLNFIDANTTAAGNQAFKFIGQGAFSGTAGELRYQKIGSDSLITGDTNGDGAADLAILSNVPVNFIKGDFIL